MDVEMEEHPMSIKVENKTIETDEEGYLLDPNSGTSAWPKPSLLRKVSSSPTCTGR